MPPPECISRKGTAQFETAGAEDAPASHAELWDALVSGRWSLIDCEDREDGRRLLLLRRNDRVRPLTPREREVARRVAIGQSNKAIAIDLGITSSGVARLLGRALRKLGLETRLQLVMLLPGSAAPTPR
ncbi:MAG: helix-turn-helix transcriptional regulator [Gemmatimonadales bacterium]